MAPEHDVAIAMLTNGGHAGGLVDDLLEPLLGELADVTKAPALLSPPAAAQVPEPRRYLGRYQTRQTLLEVALDDHGHLRLTEFPRSEALTMARAAGVTAEPRQHPLRPVDGDTFVLTEPSGAAIRAVEFLGRDAAGRARFLHTGRAAPRID